MIKIAVLVSGGGTNLQALIDAENPYGRIVLVIGSRSGIYALDRAKEAKIPTRVVSRKKWGDAFAGKMMETLGEFDVGLIVLAGYLTILPPEIIDAYEGRIVNIHPALLPAFGGMGFYGLKVHEAALARGVKITGATVHLVNEIPDGGPILAQKAVGVLAGDTPETLQRRVMEQAEWELLPHEVRKLCRNLEWSKWRV
ncbi:MAG: phosphoribosylglycinamide formyltransferase [Oscillospiraceae bacterium]|jgi:phosphoribosylglycinamide formyltransferase-1|nr:phosphoribosylglycinamide formyltransferase [Oscillospiraceae bacterium]